MEWPLFLPPPSYNARLRLSQSKTLREWCVVAGIACRASGAWTLRRVEVRSCQHIAIVAHPGSDGDVRLEVPAKKLKDKALWALYVLAYGMNDLVARQSLHGKGFTKVHPPKGRPRTGKAMSNRERQRRFQNRHKKVASI